GATVPVPGARRDPGGEPGGGAGRGARGLARRAQRGDGDGPRRGRVLQRAARRQARAPPLAAGLRLPRRRFAALRPAHHRHPPRLGGRDVDAALGRGGPRARPPQRAARAGGRGARPQPPLRRRVPRLPGRDRLPLRGGRQRRLPRFRDDGRAHRVRPGGQCPRLVDPRQPAGAGPAGDPVLLRPPEPAGHGAHPADAADQRRGAGGDPRGQPGGLRGDVPGQHRRPHPALHPGPLGGRRGGARARPLRDAVAHRAAGRPGGGPRPLGAHPQAQPAQPDRGHPLDPAHEVQRRVVGDAHRHGNVGTGAQARRHHRQREALHGLRGGQRAGRHAGGGVEHGVGDRLVQHGEGPLLLHAVVPRLRPPRRGRVRAPAGAHPDRPPRDGHHDRAVRAPARLGDGAVPAGGGERREDRLRGRPHRARARAPVAVHGAPPPARHRDRGPPRDRAGRARAGQGHRRAAHLAQHDVARSFAGDGVQRVGRRGGQPAGARDDPLLHADAGGAHGLHPGHLRPADPAPHGEAAHPRGGAPAHHAGQAARPVRGPLLPAADGGGPPGELPGAARLPVHPRRGGGLGHHARAGGGDRRLRGGRAQGAGEGELVRGRHHGRGGAQLRRSARLPGAGAALRGRGLRGRARGQLARQPAPGGHHPAGGYLHVAAADGAGAGRGAGHPHPPRGAV
ncbi:MAG: GH97, partial [uncultured Gemmatimonadetes bacterium]